MIHLDGLTACGILQPASGSNIQRNSLSDGRILCREGLTDINGTPSTRVCVECLHKLQEGHITMLALNGGHNVDTIPDALRGLTFVETLLIALCCPLEYVVSVYNSCMVTMAIKITPRAQGYSSRYSILPIKIRKIKCMVLLDWQVKNRKGLPNLDSLTVWRTSVEEAIRWVHLNNPQYKNVAVDEERLLQLPENSLPGWIAQQTEDLISEYKICGVVDWMHWMTMSDTMLLDVHFNHYTDCKWQQLDISSH